MRKLILSIITLVFFTVAVFAQNRTITGRITDAAEGTAIAGASVIVLNEKSGTKTDANGRFELSVPSGAKILEVSFIGYISEQRAINANAASVDIALRPTNDKLREVVVTAFGIKKDKKTLGYGVTQVNSEELTRAHTTNITNALTAKVPGVRVSGGGGSFSSSSI
ncbi:MAG: hypothetical protein RIS73_79, partial [Bacteroidota bacterium]